MLICAVILCLPLVVKAEPEEAEQPLTIESFIINSNENEKINATLRAVADTEISYSYTVAVITDISQTGKEVASGRGKTGEDVSVDIDMSEINSYDSYRFKITVSYTADDAEYKTSAYSKTFEYIQQSYADDLTGRSLVVDMLAKVLKINWADYDSSRADSVVVIIEADGESVVEDVIPRSDNGYDYYFDENTKQITVTLKQVFDGKTSQGITDTIDIEKSADTTDFYLVMPTDNEQYDAIWNIEYYNGDNTKLTWKSTSDKGEYELTGNGSFLIELEDDNEGLYIEYTDVTNVTWQYDYVTTIVTTAPTVTFLENYNGSSVEDSSITITGKVDDAGATVTVNGEKAEVDNNGMFSHTVDLESGENIISVEAANTVGRASRTSLTIYKSGDSGLVKDTSFLGQYATLIITLAVSVVLLVLFIIVTKKGGKKNEEEAR